MELNEHEKAFVLAEAELAKLTRHIQGLREQAQRVLSEPQGITTTTYAGPQPEVKPVTVEVDLLRLRPGQLAAQAALLDGVLAELGEAVQRYGVVAMALQDLRGKVNLRVRVDFS